MESPEADAMFGDMFEEPEGPVQGCAPNQHPKRKMESPKADAMFGDVFEEPEGPVQGCAPNQHPKMESPKADAMLEEPEGPVQGCAPNPHPKMNGKGIVQGCAPNPHPKTKGKGVEAPPPGRGETGFCGIKNQGATCYLNSLIQTLLLTPELREGLFNLGPDELGKLEDVKKKNAKVRKIPIQLQMLLARLLLLDQNACGTESLTESFGWVDSEELQQHDVQELSRILFCAIEDSLIGTSGHDIIKNLYRGITANTITCLCCGKISERTEEFLDLNIAITAQNNLTAVLRDMFVETELMNGKNQYHCDNCTKLVDARKGAVIKILPKILTVSLLRFSFDYTNLRRFKETRRFEFPLSLCMKPYCEKNSINSNNACYDYELYSAIIHSGSAHGGHYHAYIRDIDGLGTVPADYDPTPPKLSQPSPDKVGALSTDYIKDPLETLAYVLSKLGGENVPLNKLGEAFREESGTSWGKQYKRKYGTMTKFLQNNYDIFTVDNRAKTVSLRSKSQKHATGSQTTHSSTHDNMTSEKGSGDSVQNLDKSHEEISAVDGQTKGEGDRYESFENGVISDELDEHHHPLCNVWFDFNDSHVKPITTRDIEKQYEGRESAYMLFFRRKDLKRPLESLGNPTRGIPDHIHAKIQEENCSLDELRRRYDFLLNVVSIRVSFPTMFKRESGLVKMVENEEKNTTECGLSYSIDRRKTIGDMTAELVQMAEKHAENSLLDSKTMLQCNIFRVLSHGGIQLYDRIDTDPDVVVGESLLENSQTLILWDGNELHGVKVAPGDAYEPIALNMHCKICDGSNILSFDFKGVSYGNVLLADLKGYFLDKLKAENVTESSIGRSAENGEFAPFSDDDMCKTLGEMKTSHEESLQIELTLDDMDSEVNNADTVVLTLKVAPGEKLNEELRSNGYFGSPHDVFVLTSVNGVIGVSSFIHVKHLKFSILRRLFPDVRDKYSLEKLHLCIDKNTACDTTGAAKLGLHEQQSLSQAGLSKDVSSVRLEIGPPPEKREFHVTVYIQKSSKLKLPVKKCQAIEMVCIKTKPVACFIEKIITQQNLSKGSRHLHVLKSEKELVETISNPDQLIERTLIKHGSVLVLCPGSVPSEGQVQIPIWHHPKLPSFEDVQIRMRDNPTLSAWQSFLNEEQSRPVSAGYVELEKEATLFDLKRKIVQLEYFQNEGLTDIEKFCLRSVVHKLPSKYHLQETSSVKRLRFGPNIPLAVQKPSTMSKSEVSLYLSFHTPGTRIYTNLCEMHWEKTASLAQLHSDISEKLDIPIKEILLAKRGEESWDWEIIKTRDCDSKSKDPKSTNKPKKGGKQKKNQVKVKSKKPSGKTSVMPQDGDVLRAKLINSLVQGGPEVSDFKSDEELVALKRWQDSRHRESNLQIQEESKEAEAESSPSETKKKSSKPRKEEILRIHVDKF